MILLLARFLPSNRGKYTPPVPPTPPVPTESTIIIINRGPYPIEYTATPVEGDAETFTVNEGAIGELDQKVQIGSAVSTVYSSITYSPDGGDPISLDVSKLAEEVYTTYEVSTSVIEGNLVTLTNTWTNPTVTVVYKIIDSEEGAIQRNIVPGGAYDLFAGVPTGQTLSSVYEYIQVWQDTTLYFAPDMSTVVNDDIVIPIVEQNIYSVYFETDGGSEVPPQVVAPGGLVTEPAEPTKDGFTFVEWTHIGEPWDFETDTVQENIILSAVWEADWVETMVDNPTPDQTTGLTFLGYKYKAEGQWPCKAIVEGASSDVSNVGVSLLGFDSNWQVIATLGSTSITTVPAGETIEIDVVSSDGNETALSQTWASFSATFYTI